MKNLSTKFDIDDKVWSLINEKVKCYPIHSMKIEIEKDSIIVKYFLNIGTKEHFTFEIRKENQLFKTKEALIKSLD